jgi:phage-related protein
VELVSNATRPLIDIISEIVGAVFPALSKALESIGDLFGSIFSGISKTVTDVFGGLKQIFGGLIDFITGVFTGNWSKAWEGVKNIFSGVFNSLKGIFKLPINVIIDGMNWFIRGLNKLKIPDWVPGVGGFGINIGEIPRLAKGGDLATSGTVMVGEQGAELLTLPKGARVTPLNGATASPMPSQSIDTSGITAAVGEALKGWGITMDGQKVGRVVTNGVSRQQATNYYALQRSGYDGTI